MGYLKLKDAGAHSAGLNNTNRIVSARPEFIMADPLEFTVTGGSASAPQLQHAQSGLISADTELWLKFAGSAGLVPVDVVEVDENTSGGSFGGTLGTSGTDKSSALTLSNGNLTAARGASAGYSCVKTPDSNAKSSGKYYVEFDIDAFSAYAYPGMVPSGQDVSGAYFPGNAAGRGWSYQASGAVQVDGSVVATLASYGQGAKIGTAVDLTNKLFWIRNASGWLNSGDPATGANGFTLPTASSWCFCLSPYDANSQQTINLGASAFEYTPPAGFAPLTTYTLSGLSPAQSALPEKAYKLRTDISKALMALAKGATDQSFSTSDFTIPVAIASVSWATGPELTVTGAETEITGDTTRRLALKLRSDITSVQPRARAAKIYIKELTA